MENLIKKAETGEINKQESDFLLRLKRGIYHSLQKYFKCPEIELDEIVLNMSYESKIKIALRQVDNTDYMKQLMADYDDYVKNRKG